MIAFDKVYDHHLSLIERCGYITNITEDILLDFYSEVLLLHHQRDQIGFTEEHRHIYYRLKLRSLIPQRPLGAPPVPPFSRSEDSKAPEEESKVAE